MMKVLSKECETVLSLSVRDHLVCQRDGAMMIVSMESASLAME